MAEIKIPISVPGAVDSARQAREFAAALHGSAAAAKELVNEEKRLDAEAMKYEQMTARATRALDKWRASMRATAMEARRMSPANDAARFNQSVRQTSRFSLPDAPGSDDRGFRRGVGGVISRFGGAAGRFGSAMGMPVGFGAAAMGATAVGVAFGALSAVSDALVQRQARLRDMMGQLSDSISDQVDAAQKERAGQFKSERTANRFIKLSGMSDIGNGMMKDLNSKGFRDVSGGVASALSVADPKVRSKLVEVAKILAINQDINFSTAMRQAMGERGRLGRGGDMLGSATRILNKEFHLQGEDLLTPNQVGNQTRRYHAGLAPEGRSVDLAEGRAEMTRRRGGAAAYEAGVLSGMVAVSRPEAVAEGQWYKAKEREIAMLEASAKAQNGFLAFLQEFTPGGSRATQLFRLRNDVAEASFASPATPHLPVGSGR